MGVLLLNGSDHNGQRAQNAADPTADQDLATKKYVDSKPSGGSSSSPANARRRLIPSIGDYYTMRANSNLASSTADGVLDLGPQFLPGGTYDQVRMNVTNAASAGGLLRVVGYWGTDYQGATVPGTKAFETAAVDATTTGDKAIAIPGGLVIPNDSLPLWVGAVSQGAPTTASRWTNHDLNAWNPTEVVTNQVLFYAYVQTGWRLTAVTGAAPATATGATRAPSSALWAYFRRSA